MTRRSHRSGRAHPENRTPAPNRDRVVPARLSRRHWAILAALCVALAVFRLWFVLGTPQVVVHSDASGYDAAARRLIATHSFAFPVGGNLWADDLIREDAWTTYLATPANAFSMPGYPAFAAVTYAAVGEGAQRLSALRAVQALLSVASTVLLFLLVLRLTRDRRAAWAAFALAALYPPNTWVNGYLLTEPLFTVLLLASAVLVCEAAERGGAIWYAGLAAAVAGAVYVRSTAILLPFLYAGYVAARVMSAADRPKAARQALVGGAVSVALIALAMLPWVLRNAGVYGSFVPLTSASSLTSMIDESFALGQVPQGVLAQDIDPAGARDDHAWAQRVSARFATQFDLADDSKWVRLADIKLGKLGRAVLSPFTFDSQYYSWPSAMALMQVALYSVAAIGAFALRRDPAALLLLLGGWAAFIAAHTLTTVMSRYLYPGTYFVLALAGIGLSSLLAAAGTARR